MRQPLVAGNWKMHGARDESTDLASRIVHGMGRSGAVELLLCPPFTLIASVAERIVGSRITLGGQNLNEYDSGAHTGEISGSMLKELGCDYVIVGHSERRTLYAETDERVAAKFEAAQRHGLIPILCVGETLSQREAGATIEVVESQLEAVLERVGVQGFERAVVAYEPVWAIGTGRTAGPDQAQEVHACIRGRLSRLSGDVARKVRILYGGSVKPDNASQLFAQADIDGGLIGGASLHADQFLEICDAF